jgi:hypothetical protein
LSSMSLIFLRLSVRGAISLTPSSANMKDLETWSKKGGGEIEKIRRIEEATGRDFENSIYTVAEIPPYILYSKYCFYALHCTRYLVCRASMPGAMQCLPYAFFLCFKRDCLTRWIGLFIHESIDRVLNSSPAWFFNYSYIPQMKQSTILLVNEKRQ